MTLKVGMQYMVLRYYQDCSNDDPMLTLTCFTARSDLVPYGFVKDKMLDFSETFVVYDIKVGRFSQLKEYMNLYEYQRSKSFINLHPRSLWFNIFKLLLLGNHLANLKPNFIWSLHGMWGMKICSNVPGHMTMPIYMVKSFKNLLLRNQEADDLQTWYTASSTTSVFIWWLWVDLDHFYDGSNLFLNASAWLKAYTALSANIFPGLF